MQTQDAIDQVPLEMVQPEGCWVDCRAVDPKEGCADGKADKQRMLHDGRQPFPEGPVFQSQKLPKGNGSGQHDQLMVAQGGKQTGQQGGAQGIAVALPGPGVGRQQHLQAAKW